jgi:DnaJ-class molecular chaperone
MPDVSGGRAVGDLLITVRVVTPQKLTREQKKAIEQLATVLPAERFEPAAREHEDDEKNLFDRVKDIFG